MDVLFQFLPVVEATECLNSDNSMEWSEAIKCLGKARPSWLLGLLEVSDTNLTEENSLFKLVKRIQVKASLVQTGSIPLNELGKVKACMLNTRSAVIWNALVDVAASLRHAKFDMKRQWLLDTLQISCAANHPSTGLRFLGLLCGNWCRYMPILTFEDNAVLSDLPMTLSSFLLDNESRVKDTEDPIILALWRLTERIYSWRESIASGETAGGQQSINRSENEEATFLLRIVYEACVAVRKFMSLEMQLKLANMLLPSTS